MLGTVFSPEQESRLLSKCECGFYSLTMEKVLKNINGVLHVTLLSKDYFCSDCLRKVEFNMVLIPCVSCC
jgi:hypothetical protein